VGIEEYLEGNAAGDEKIEKKSDIVGKFRGNGCG
jgi:hypothetical protein